MALPYSLRGDSAKERFLREYSDTKCIEHTVPLSKKNYKCCCGDEFQGEYYLFSYGPEKHKQQFFVSQHCCERLRKLGDIHIPNFFNPFFQDDALREQQLRIRHDHVHSSHENTNELPENKEMRDAISLLFYLWSHQNTEGILYDIRKTLQDNPHQKIGEKRLRILNNAIQATAKRRYGQDMTLRKMFQAFALEHGRRAKEFGFPCLENRCREFGIQCHL